MPDPLVTAAAVLALVLLAANERGSAWVQWLRLAPADRIAAEILARYQTRTGYAKEPTQRPALGRTASPS